MINLITLTEAFKPGNANLVSHHALPTEQPTRDRPFPLSVAKDFVSTEHLLQTDIQGAHYTVTISLTPRGKQENVIIIGHTKNRNVNNRKGLFEVGTELIIDRYIVISTISGKVVKDSTLLPNFEGIESYADPDSIICSSQIVDDRSVLSDARTSLTYNRLHEVQTKLVSKKCYIDDLNEASRHAIETYIEDSAHDPYFNPVFMPTPRQTSVHSLIMYASNTQRSITFGELFKACQMTPNTVPMVFKSANDKRTEVKPSTRRFHAELVSAMSGVNCKHTEMFIHVNDKDIEVKLSEFKPLRGSNASNGKLFRLAEELNKELRRAVDFSEGIKSIQVEYNISGTTKINFVYEGDDVLREVVSSNEPYLVSHLYTNQIGLLGSSARGVMEAVIQEGL